MNDVFFIVVSFQFLLSSKKKLEVYAMKTSYHGKCLNDVYLLVELIKKLTSSLGSILFLKFNFFWHEHDKFKIFLILWKMTFKTNFSLVFCNASCCQVSTYFTLPSTSSTFPLFYYFSSPHLFCEERILVWTSLLKILRKYHNWFRKGFFEVITTSQNYNLLLYWKWPKEKQFANLTSFRVA